MIRPGRHIRIPQGSLSTFMLIVLLASFMTGSLPAAHAQGAPPAPMDVGPQAAGTNFNSSFNGNAAGWQVIFGTWTLTNASFYKTLGVKNAFSSIAHRGTYGNFVYQAKLKRLGCSVCPNSLVVRGKPGHLDSTKRWLPSYVFSYTSNGQFSVWKINSTGLITRFKNWTGSPAILKGSNWNVLKVVAVGPTMQFFINGTRLWVGRDGTYPSGRLGINLYRNATSGNTLYVDWAKLSLPKASDLSPDAGFTQGIEVPGGDTSATP